MSTTQIAATTMIAGERPRFHNHVIYMKQSGPRIGRFRNLDSRLVWPCQGVRDDDVVRVEFKKPWLREARRSPQVPWLILPENKVQRNGIINDLILIHPACAVGGL